MAKSLFRRAMDKINPSEERKLGLTRREANELEAEIRKLATARNELRDEKLKDIEGKIQETEAALKSIKERVVAAIELNDEPEEQGLLVQQKELEKNLKQYQEEQTSVKEQIMKLEREGRSRMSKLRKLKPNSEVLSEGFTKNYGKESPDRVYSHPESDQSPISKAIQEAYIAKYKDMPNYTPPQHGKDAAGNPTTKYHFSSHDKARDFFKAQASKGDFTVLGPNGKPAFKAVGGQFHEANDKGEFPTINAAMPVMAIPVPQDGPRHVNAKPIEATPSVSQKASTEESALSPRVKKSTARSNAMMAKDSLLAANPASSRTLPLLQAAPTGALKKEASSEIARLEKVIKKASELKEELVIRRKCLENSINNPRKARDVELIKKEMGNIDKDIGVIDRGMRAYQRSLKKEHANATNAEKVQAYRGAVDKDRPSEKPEQASNSGNTLET